jgi:glycosyltransferase involved in cell wall biosynthesis
MWNGKRVSVILPTYNEKDSIRGCIEGFLETGYVDEVIVVNNNAVSGTSEEVAGTGAIEVREPRQGYGWACRKGLENSSGDLLVLCEPDGTFEPRDILKLLAYSVDFDYVLGTRTTKEYIWAGANMGFFLKWGNVVTAKLIEVLFNSSILTDVGCTLRLISRDAYERVRGAIRVGDSAFGPHLTLLMLAAGVEFTEISVNYRPRVGLSAVTGSFAKAFFLGLRMIGMVVAFRLRTWLSRKYPPELIRHPLPIAVKTEAQAVRPPPRIPPEAARRREAEGVAAPHSSSAS